MIQLSRFLSEGGQLITPPYHKNPPSDDIVAEWDEHIRKVASEIEQRLFARKGKLPVGYARLYDLFAPAEWPQMPLYSLAKRVDVGDMAYLWIRCSEKDLWVLCLRRRSYEPPFSDRDFAILEEFGLWFGGNRQSWYIGELHSLSARELECVRLLASGKAAKEAAKALGIKQKTYEKHLENVRKKLGADSSFELLGILLNRGSIVG